MLKFRHLFWLIVVWLYGHALFAQKNADYKLYLRNGTFSPPANLSGAAAGAILREKAFPAIGKLVIIQFNNIPEEQAVAQLKNAGIELLAYVPDNAYTAVIRQAPDAALLVSANARAIIELTPDQKIHAVLTAPTLPAHTLKVPGKVDVSVSYPRSIALSDVRQDLQKHNFEIISETLSRYQVLEVRLDTNRLEQLAALPWVEYIEPVAAPTVPLNDKSTAGSRANMLATGLPSGVKLDGEGIAIGIGDNGNPTEHGDMSGRIVSYIPVMGDWHGVHVTGTVAGAGIINEKYKGYAPKAMIVKRSNDEIWRRASSLFQEFGMVLTNNSYASDGGGNCEGYGAYTFHSNVLDKQANDLIHVQHVFAAGNSGQYAPCEVYPAGFGNVQGHYASAKNVITVGQIAQNGLVSPYSSKGPAQDGRMKPELVAPGTDIFSTLPNDKYDDATGTSMAAPAVTGGAALLYQRYRQLHDQQNPKSALIKALLCNGASDKGLRGPDFSYGFGAMNLLRSVTMLEKGRYFNGTLAHEGEAEFQISIPAGAALVKVMLYWNDTAGTAVAGSKAIVNNLDLTVAPPVGSDLLPLVPDPASPQTAAVAGVDLINNAEQVMLDSPAAGIYTLKIKGTNVPSGPQEYFLVYDIIEKSVVLTYPAGSEHLAGGDVVNVCWDSYGNPQSTFAVSYSLNNGATWAVINASVPAGTNQLRWTVPNAFTATAKIRLVQNETGIVKESGTFSIMGLPVVTLAPIQCEGYAAVQWTAVTGATDYEVMRLQDAEMTSVGVTTGLNYTFTGLSRDTTYYFSVLPRLNGTPGRRAIAVKRKPDSGTCEGAISNNDVGVESIVSPKGSGRMFTSTSLSATQAITIRIQNFDDQPVTRSFEVGYSTGGPGAAVHWETITSGIPALGFLEHTFNKTVDFYAAGDYQVNVFVNMQGDIMQVNNQKSIQLVQLPNLPITLPYTEGFESLPPQLLRADRMGLMNAPAYDFTTEQKIGRLTTYGDPGAAYSGEKALIIDGDNGNYRGYESSVCGTYNLAEYKTQSQEIRLSFRLRQNVNSGGVYVRGKDSDPWVLATSYHQYQYGPVDKDFTLFTIQVSELLKNNSQELSSSFQVKWELGWGRGTYIIDDVRLYTAHSDVEMIELSAPELSTCSYGSQNLSVLVKNNGDEDIFNVPLLVTVDGQEAARETIPVVRAGSDTLYRFNAYSNLYVEGDHVVKALLNYGFDVNAANDSRRTIITTPPVIATFPYLEDFEEGPGGWQTLGPNSAWQFGRPNSAKVKGAASGENAWKTNLTGTYQSDSAYLYSPCIDLSRIGSVRLSFSFFIDKEACGAGCEMPSIEYEFTKGVWFNLYGIEWGDLQGQSRWRSASIQISGYSLKRLRIAIKGISLKNTEGMAIDNIHIYEMPGEITNESSPLPIVRQSVQGSNWVDFTQFGSMVASIQPNGQELGDLSLMTYLKNDEVGDRNGQYYMGRSYKFGASQPSFPKPVGVRFYFLESDVERLVNAPEKPGVSKPASAYEMTVTKYSGINEDGDLVNNAGKIWGYFPKSEVRLVPYWNGYYAEFQTKSFSEFWLAKGFLGLGDPMPVTLATFTVKPRTDAENKQTVLVEWQTAREEAFSHFEVEVAKDREGLLGNRFTKIGEVPGLGGSSRYAFTDNAPLAERTSYYRLKMVDTDGSFAYSSVRAVNFEGEKLWKVFPNPAEKRIFVEFEEKAGKVLHFNVSDVGGRVVFTDKAVADGRAQQKEIDLSTQATVPGVYLLKVVSEDRERIFKIIRK
ncbi:MAG: S8 family serine peptidase [Dyadobacter sp.]|uniref:S8 family serine peptidase n=1 Tax=Dyadobacter sp. TaxID=1914288 RepID=UPI001B299FF1|nr:S8 family serine peptidase [Dyadobacter sp.]MBO9617062.1 S8 family serine peptidase [Dyadobacter sp.]